VTGKHAGMAHESAADGGGAAPKPAVLAELGSVGDAVPWNTSRRVVLGGTDTLWLVSNGAVDLYAADAAGQAAPEYLGAAEAGALLAGSMRRNGRVILARPQDQGAMRRIPVAELAGRPPRRAAAAIADAVDAGLLALLGAAAAPPTDAMLLYSSGSASVPAGREVRSGGDVRWVLVRTGELATPDGTVRHGPGAVVVLAGNAVVATQDTALDVRDSRDLLTGGALWAQLAEHQEQFLARLDAAIAERERHGGERLHLAQQAGERAFARAEGVLRTVATRGAGQRSLEPGTSACQLVAAAAGIAVPAGFAVPEESTAESVAQFAAALGCRSRQITLPNGWWRDSLGPLVGRGPDGQLVALLPRRGGYVVADPATGMRRRVGDAVAGSLNSSATVFYRPLPEGTVSGFTLVRYGLRGSKGDLARMLASLLAGAGAGLALPIMTGKILGEYVNDAQTTLIELASIAVMVTAVTIATLNMLGGVAMVRIQGRADAMLQSAVWDRLLRLPTGFFRRSSTGEIASAALGISGIRQVVASIATVVVNSAIIAVVNVALMAYYSGVLTILAAVLVAGHFALFSAIGYRQLHWQTRLLELRYKLSDLVYQRLRGLAKLRIAAAEGFAYSQWADTFARAQELARRARRLQNAATIVNVGYAPLCTLLVYAVVSGPAHGRLSTAQFLSWITAFGATLAVMTQVTSLLSTVGAIIPMYGKLRPILSETPETTSGRAAPGTLSGYVEFRDVSHRYTSDGPLVLNQINLKINPGEFVAVVGPTGSGKSTLLRLLLGFDNPTAGTVVYDQRDLRGLDLTAVRQQCGVVLQHAAPFAGSVFENIRGTANATLEQAWEAATMAGLDDDIRRMPMTMHTMIPDGGETLSGGQRQRLLIAQALIRRPRIIFLDEATSALDNETQRTVSASIRGLAATRVVIAHRLSTVMDADRVIVLDDGRIVQEGTPAELLSDAAGTFHQLVLRQL
jgi:NHLM bacteriocin system ABC transporter ATP-binding protein